jgi:hypothetical protein
MLPAIPLKLYYSFNSAVGWFELIDPNDRVVWEALYVRMNWHEVTLNVRSPFVRARGEPAPEGLLP